jgi:hypothetical protein
VLRNPFFSYSYQSSVAGLLEKEVEATAFHFYNTRKGQE